MTAERQLIAVDTMTFDTPRSRPVFCSPGNPTPILE